MGVGLAASGDFKRQNLRHFIVSETFEDILKNEKLHCDPEYRNANYAYPVAGNIGLAELISTFIDLNELRPLASDKSTSKVFADTLTFTTTISGSASPHVIVAPVNNRWGLASPAGFTASASRVDKHALIMGLSLDDPKGKTALLAPLGGNVGGYPKSALQKASPVSPSEQSALDTVSQARLDAYPDRATR